MKEETETTWHFGFYLVAYVDLLGQQDELMKLASLPHTQEEKEEVLQILRRPPGE